MYNAKQNKYMLGSSEHRASMFYMLPKIHKDPTKWNKPHEIPQGRPTVYIIWQCSSIFTWILSRSYSLVTLKIYMIFGGKKIQIPRDAILFTMDIDSLYINIDIQEGIQAIKNIFYKRPDKKKNR